MICVFFGRISKRLLSLTTKQWKSVNSQKPSQIFMVKKNWFWKKQSYSQKISKTVFEKHLPTLGGGGSGRTGPKHNFFPHRAITIFRCGSRDPARFHPPPTGRRLCMRTFPARLLCCCSPKSRPYPVWKADISHQSETHSTLHTHPALHC